jgi:tetratricopeptide (TPR) repeat protein
MKRSLSVNILILCLVAMLMFTTVNCKKKAASKYPGQMTPGSPEFLLNEGIVYLNSGNLEMAEKKLKKALKKKPMMLSATNALGIVYLNQRQFSKAITHFTKVVRTNPDHFDAYNYLGVTYTEMGEYNLAKENLLKAANATKYRTPENAFANLANLELKYKRYEAALRYVDKGLQKNDRFPPLSNLKGIILENKKEYKKALLWYERAVSLLTEPDVTFLINIGRIYTKLGDNSKALDVLEKALGKATTPQLKTQIHKMIANLDKK